MNNRQPATTPFIAWLIRTGEAEAARILGVSQRQVRSWRYRERQPRMEALPELVRRSRGALRLESFFAPEQLQDIQHD